MDKKKTDHHYADVIDLKELISIKTGLNVRQYKSNVIYTVTLSYSEAVKE